MSRKLLIVLAMSLIALASPISVATSDAKPHDKGGHGWGKHHRSGGGAPVYVNFSYQPYSYAYYRPYRYNRPYWYSSYRPYRYYRPHRYVSYHRPYRYGYYRPYRNYYPYRYASAAPSRFAVAAEGFGGGTSAACP